MIRRFTALSVISSAAMLGYVGARRLGEWLDAPVSAPATAPAAAAEQSPTIAHRSVHQLHETRDKTPA